MSKDEMEICDACNGAGGDNQHTICGKCSGSGGVPATPSRSAVSEELTPEMIEAGRVAYFHYRGSIESDVRFCDLTSEEQEDFVQRIYTAMQAARPTPDLGEDRELVATFRQQLRALRDSQGMPADDRIEVNFGALCDVLVSGYDVIDRLESLHAEMGR